MKELLYKVLFHLMRKGPKWGNFIMDIIPERMYYDVIATGFNKGWNKK